MSSFCNNITLKGMLWSAVDRYSSQVLQFVFLIVLARLLSPSDFGMSAVVMSFILVSQEIIGGGFLQSLIRKQEQVVADLCSALVYNVLMAIVCVVILFICSQHIATFWGYPEMKNYIRILSLSLLFYSLLVVPTAILTSAVDFKAQAYASTISVIIAGSIAVVIAWNGGGLLSIVVQQVVLNLVKSFALWSSIKWKYAIRVSRESFVSLFSYGYKVLLYGLLDIGATQLTSLIIGKKYTANDLGFYSKGQQIAMFPSVQLSYAISRVVFPLLSKCQFNKTLLIEEFTKFLRISSLLIVFLMFVLATLASPIINFVLGEAWIELVPFLQIFCVAFMFDQVNSLNQTLLYIEGRSDLWLKLGVINRIIAIIIVLIALPFGPIVIALSKVVHSQIELIITTYYSGKLYKLGYWGQLKCVSKYVILSIISCAIPFIIVQRFEIGMIGALIGGALAFIIYMAFLRIVKDDIFLNLILPRVCSLYKH